MDALDFSRVLSGAPRAAIYVHGTRHSLEMIGVTARPNPAQMINLEPIGNRADQTLVVDSMGGDSLA
jgi:hypothetical protein